MCMYVYIYIYICIKDSNKKNIELKLNNDPKKNNHITHTINKDKLKKN